ncbi:hypothetical protein RND71_029159 [Anisodus tanguticus]|uniref:Uncharacterized protein n=1 Tax=Anisodus tanguticus TaxID=243964 RepID=A0AAE1RDH8_9SOLA|nr:hypothetical protein RND71_029159 [Anisodus tanguticus]
MPTTWEHMLYRICKSGRELELDRIQEQKDRLAEQISPLIESEKARFQMLTRKSKEEELLLFKRNQSSWVRRQEEVHTRIEEAGLIEPGSAKDT